MHKEKEKVSIISTVYNGEKYIEYFLDSIINQTYNNIELIIINDGSNDKTEYILKKYIDKFKNRGYAYRLFEEENKGLAGAVNFGLKKFTGDYLKWIDADDMLDATCIEKQVQCLKKNNNADFVICDSEYIKYEDFSHIKDFGRKVKNGVDDYFLDILQGKHNYSLGSGTILIKTISLKKVIPDLDIYESRYGQNYQLMLPITYFCKWVYLREPLFKRVIRKDSLSQKQMDYNEIVYKWNEFKKINYFTLEKMNIENVSYYKKIVDLRVWKELFYIYYSYNKPKQLNKVYFNLIKSKNFDFSMFKKFIKTNIKRLYHNG